MQPAPLTLLIAAAALLEFSVATSLLLDPPESRIAAPENRPSSIGLRAQLGDQPALRFVEATAEAGLRFRHDNGSTGEHYMVETIGSGVAIIDLDADGLADLYLVQGAATPGYQPPEPLLNALYRNLGEGSFSDVSALAAVDDPGLGMGVAAADYDNDGFIDLYITNFGPNVLYRNNGDGTFSEVTVPTGVGDVRWGTSAAWADIDNDGNLDLYVVNYVDFHWDNHKFCGSPRRNLRAYCHPDVYGGLTDTLFHNRGDGSFVDVSATAGISNATEGKGLGVVFADYDNDGDIDLYVANDSTRNFLYTNGGDGSFLDDGLLAGVGYNEDGAAESGMGTDWGDHDRDGQLDVFVTNLDLETNTLYRNLGDATFSDVTFSTGLGEPSLLSVGFGANWIDYDNDADLDLFVANGHIIDNIESFKDNVTYAQANHVFENDGGGRFTAVHQELGPGMQLVKVSRGSAIGDTDNDGDLDLLISNNNESADYLRNDGGNQAGHWIQLLLVGRTASRSASGARVLVAPQTEQNGGTGNAAASIILEVRAGSSYCSTSDRRLHTGLGTADAASVTVRWPGGDNEPLDLLQADRLYIVQQGRGVVASRGASSR